MSASRKAPALSFEEGNAMITNIAGALRGAIAFQEGEGDAARYLVFLPGNPSFKGSKYQRDSVKSRLGSANAHSDALNIEPMSFSDRAFTINGGKRSAATAFCLEFDASFGSFADMMERRKMGVPVISCDTFDSPLIASTIERYANDPERFVMPGHLNGVAHEEPVVREKKKPRIVSRRVDVATIAANPPNADADNAAKLLREKEEAKAKAELEKEFKKSIIAHPKGMGVALFLPKGLQEVGARGILRESWELSEEGAKALAFVHNGAREKLVSGMMHILIRADEGHTVQEKMDLLVAKFGLKVFNGGQEADLTEIRKFKAEAAIAHERMKAKTGIT